MLIGRVIGPLVSTVKHKTLVGAKLLLVQPLTLEGQPKGVPVLTIDSVGAGIGDRVLYLIEGKAAQDALGRKGAPVDAAIMGIVDSVEFA
jgi:ethanolamine utilization protein EutN